jgi:alkaline phosphatase D
MDLTRRALCAGMPLLGLAGCATGMFAGAGELGDVTRIALESPVIRIGFGSCMRHDRPQPFWEAIAAHRPHAFACLGDSIYPKKSGGTFATDAEAIAFAYARQAERADFMAFRAAIPFLGVWDDNDYGASDAGGEYPYKDVSRQLFLDFLGEPQESPRRTRFGGLYVAYEFGPADRVCQLILPDLRYSRSPWRRADDALRGELGRSGFGPYLPKSSQATLLGAEQWAWLERVLARPADVRLIASSIQALAAARGWEGWSNFPHEQARLIDRVDRAGGKALFLSGDAHFAEVSAMRAPSGAMLFDVTSSGLTESWPEPGPNTHRWGQSAFTDTNFGLVHINLADASPVIAFELYRTDGARLLQHAI